MLLEKTSYDSNYPIHEEKKHQKSILKSVHTDPCINLQSDIIYPKEILKFASQNNLHGSQSDIKISKPNSKQLAICLENLLKQSFVSYTQYNKAIFLRDKIHKINENVENEVF